MRKISMVDLKAQYKKIKPEIDRAVSNYAQNIHGRSEGPIQENQA